VLALDVVELHPDRDREDRTAKLARDVILAVARAQAHLRALIDRDGLGHRLWGSSPIRAETYSMEPLDGQLGNVEAPKG
jgi:hypothetical protein